jgi:hypothetical protein
MRTLIIVTLVLIIILFSSCSKTPTTTEQTPPTRTLLEQQVDKFASTDVGSPLEDLKAKDLTLLNKLVEASDQIDEIFWRQAYAKNPELRQKLEVSKDPKDQTTLHLFNIMRGPFDRLQDNKPFLGTQPKPRGAGFYPEDLTKEEFQKWVADHPKDAAAFESPYTVIQRDGKKLKAVPYSEAYKQWLEPAAKNLEEAAALTDDAALKKFLLSRAKAFRTNDYYQSDMDWMDAAGSKMDVTIGPYEVYEDALLNQKASFEAFIGVRDDESSKALSVYESYIDALENNLPLDPKYQSSRKGKLSPLIVINELYTGGEARRGVQTAAFTLPNDERVRAAKGSKKIMLKNVMQAKFAKTLVPIAIRLVVDDQLPNVKFDPFFNHVLLHEMSHALGPGLIQKGKDKITVNKALKDQYSAIEEAKADVLGLYNVEFLAQKKVFSEVELPSHYISYLASLFRSVRFGAEEAHGRANLLQFNFLMKEGGIQFDDKRLKFRADIEKMKAATKKLATVLLTIEAEGDYDGAKKLMEEQGTMSPQLQSALRRLSDIPVDIEPVFLIGRK